MLSSDSGGGMDFRPDPVRPVEIQELGSHELKITWQDGHQSLYRYSQLRGKCRCAACVDEGTGEPRILPEKISEEIHPLATRPVGNYGIRFDWSDGHNTGIYAFEYLRSLCSCPACSRQS